VEFARRAIGLGLEQKLTAARSPWQSPFVERLIGSIRRECLDHVIVLNEGHLHRRLSDYLTYYNNCKVRGLPRQKNRTVTHNIVNHDPQTSRLGPGSGARKENALEGSYPIPSGRVGRGGILYGGSLDIGWLDVRAGVHAGWIETDPLGRLHKLRRW
jgi:hypothetical protein